MIAVAGAHAVPRLRRRSRIASAPDTLARLTTIGYRVQAPRFLRTAALDGAGRVGAAPMYLLHAVAGPLQQPAARGDATARSTCTRASAPAPIR